MINFRNSNRQLTFYRSKKKKKNYSQKKYLASHLVIQKESLVGPLDLIVVDWAITRFLKNGK